MHKLVFLLIAVCLTGCASNQLGGFADISPVDQNSSSSPLKISARFSPYHCSDYFAYLDFSIENPTSKWQMLSNLELNFPYQSNDLFSVVEGRRLALWREGEGHRQRLENHNDALVSLAVAGAGLGLMASDNDAAQTAGATLFLGNNVKRTAEGISRDIDQIETSAPVFQNYLVGGDLEIPPGMTRKFWLVLSADEQAPLMASIGGEFKDTDGVQQVFKMPLEGWEMCQWQKSRKDFLRSVVSSKELKEMDTLYRRKKEQEAMVRKENDIQQARLVDQ